jgi:hypothetical protein
LKPVHGLEALNSRWSLRTMKRWIYSATKD